MSIKYISFLWGEERKKVFSKRGKFPIKTYKSEGPRIRPITERYTAFEFVNLDEIRLADPVLNFEDGSKMRVYQNGDPSYMIVESASKIEKHDKRYVRKRFHAPSKQEPDGRSSWEDLFDYDGGF